MTRTNRNGDLLVQTCVLLNKEDMKLINALGYSTSEACREGIKRLIRDEQVISELRERLERLELEMGI